MLPADAIGELDAIGQGSSPVKTSGSSHDPALLAAGFGPHCL
ncbi:hypothetical protein [Streptomyces sp. NPDC008141]